MLGATAITSRCLAWRWTALSNRLNLCDGTMCVAASTVHCRNTRPAKENPTPGPNQKDGMAPRPNWWSSPTVSRPGTTAGGRTTAFAPTKLANRMPALLHHQAPTLERALKSAGHPPRADECGKPTLSSNPSRRVRITIQATLSRGDRASSGVGRSRNQASVDCVRDPQAQDALELIFVLHISEDPPQIRSTFGPIRPRPASGTVSILLRGKNSRSGRPLPSPAPGRP